MQHTSYIPLHAKSQQSVQHILLQHKPAENCSVGLRSWVYWCNTYCLQPCMGLFVFIGLAAFMHGWELSTLVVILSVFHIGNSLSAWTSCALQPLVFLHWWEKLFSIVLLYLESHTRYRKSRKLEKPFFGPKSLKMHFRRLAKCLKICQHIVFK